MSYSSHVSFVCTNVFMYSYGTNAYYQGNIRSTLLIDCTYIIIINDSMPAFALSLFFLLFLL